MSPKAIVRLVFPDARLDFYEFLREKKRPCWFIRRGQQGEPLGRICRSPASAWRDAAGNYAPKAFASTGGSR